MPNLIKDGELIADAWRYVADDEPLPAPDADIVVGWQRWCDERDDLLARSGQLGVRVSGDVAPEELARDREHFALIALEFPQFRDGRCYSHARLLRERYAYRGELRAVGDVLRDQMFYMSRVGINAFELPPGTDPHYALQGLRDFDVSYQAAADQHVPVWRRRRMA